MNRSVSATDEPALVRRAQDGDVRAFEALLRTHDDRMRALAFGMLGSASAMDDVLQDAYVRAFRALPGFRGDARFSTWLHRIVATTCLDHGRRLRRRAEDALPDEPAPPGGPPPDPAGDHASGRLDLRRALEALSPEHRAVILLIDGEGLSYDEAAAILDVSPGTVSSRLTRARATMRELLHPTTDDTREGLR